jgi:protein CLEC16A
MNELIYLSNFDSREISIQIIKSFSILILNISSQTTIYFIFSNNFLNQIISRSYEKYDDEFVAYYISFIKSLSLKIDTTTVQFFFHRQYNTFPLMESALKFYNHHDSMIKTTVKNIFLTFIRCK